jgi:AcrR family transcriptional regulator
MSKTASEAAELEPAHDDGHGDATARRRYDSPLRRQQAAETRQRIVTAGLELLHDVPIWKWGALTIRAVAERAGVNERTVYRYFPSERALRDAVLEHLRAEAGVSMDGLAFDDVQRVTARMFEYISSFPFEPRVVPDATVAAANAGQRDALLAAVAARTEEWNDVQRSSAAAILDVLWSVVSYERLVADWELEPKQAVSALTWAIGVVQNAISAGEVPQFDVEQTETRTRAQPD